MVLVNTTIVGSCAILSFSINGAFVHKEYDNIHKKYFELPLNMLLPIHKSPFPSKTRKKLSMAKHWSGQTCPETATYGQYHDTNDKYAGVDYDRYVEKGKTFPPSQNNHHFQKK